jgi:hypothetical protein
VIVDKIKWTKVASFNLVAEFRAKTVKKLFIFFTVLKNDEKSSSAKNSRFITSAGFIQNILFVMESLLQK